jgi:hypothetical protein
LKEGEKSDFLGAARVRPEGFIWLGRAIGPGAGARRRPIRGARGEGEVRWTGCTLRGPGWGPLVVDVAHEGMGARKGGARVRWGWQTGGALDGLGDGGPTHSQLALRGPRVHERTDRRSG